MKNPLISVIIPVYKVEQYLNQCLDSIVNQTYANLEIILVDDGSPDRCPQICDEYAKRDKRIKVIHKENGGLSAARNSGLDVCKGEYIAFVDSDDWIEQDMYSSMMTQIQERDLDMVFCTASIIRGDKKVETRFLYFPNGTIKSPEEMVRASLIDSVGGQVWLRLSSRKCWEHVRFPEGRLYEDLAISYKPFLYCKKGIGFLSPPFYNYRMNPNGISLHMNPQQNYNIFLAYRDHYVYSFEHLIDVSEICLGKTALFAIGYCNNRIRYGYVGNDDCLIETEKWLKLNWKLITKCKALSIERKFMIALYLSSKTVYKGLYRIVLKLERHGNE